jgi:hypothetical protein
LLTNVPLVTKSIWHSPHYLLPDYGQNVVDLYGASIVQTYK